MGIETPNNDISFNWSKNVKQLDEIYSQKNLVFTKELKKIDIYAKEENKSLGKSSND